MSNAFSLLGQEVEYTIEKMDIFDLRYLPDNPRVYTALRANRERDVDQERIHELMIERDHVRRLRKNIETNGQLNAVFVRRDTMEVVEGNSRLAAFRMLEDMSPGKWSKINCQVIETLTARQTRALLAQYHLHGVTDWSAYEQANMFHVHHEKGASLDDLSREMGETTGAIQKKIDVIKLMDANRDVAEKHFAYYEQILSRKAIKSAFESHQTFRTCLLKGVKRETLGTTATIFRDKLTVVCEQPGSPAFRKFARGEYNLDDAYDRAVASGAGVASLKKLKRFKEWVADKQVRDNLVNQPDLKKVRFDADKIITSLKKVIAKIDKKLDEK